MRRIAIRCGPSPACIKTQYEAGPFMLLANFSVFVFKVNNDVGIIKMAFKRFKLSLEPLIKEEKSLCNSETCASNA